MLERYDPVEDYIRGGSRTAATYKMELFVIIVNGFQSLTIITKSSISDVAEVLARSASVYDKNTLLKNTFEYFTECEI